MRLVWWVACTLASLGSVVAVACSSSDGGAPAPADAGVDQAAPDEDAAVDAGDFGAPSDTYPAYRPSLPQAVNLIGGPTLKDFTVVPVVFATDPEGETAITFMTKYAASPEWRAQVQEYGVGTMTIGTPITLSQPAPATIADPDIRTWLRTQLDGSHPEWGPTDAATLAKTLFFVIYPFGTTVTKGAESSCTFGGYHSVAVLPPDAGAPEAGADAATDAGADLEAGVAPGIPVLYAVSARCTLTELTQRQTTTMILSHELLEVATDPFPSSGYQTVDRDHLVWPIGMHGGEIADLCNVVGAAYPPADLGFTIARAWSNASAAASHDPCGPSPKGEPYFLSFINPTDTYALGAGGAQTKGLRVPVGQTHTYDVLLMSDAPTSGPFAIRATEVPMLPTNAPVLGLSFDRTRGVNGEKVHLAIHAKAALVNGATAIMIESTLGTKRTLWFSIVLLH
jgi:hypothetical protein